MLPELQVDRARVADLDAQIAELERALCTIRAEKALVQDRLDSYQYPVLTLPNEIISEIFVHFLPVYPACPPLTGILSPTNLTQICREWRELALATPLLWRAIRLPFTNIPQRQAQKIDMCFNMSGCCPISLEIGEYNSSLDSKVVDALAPHHARWEHIKLVLAYLPRNHLLLLFTRPMPLLRHLELDFNEDDEDEVSDPIVFGEAPLLHSVSLDLDVAPNKLVLPWAQLTSLTLRGPEHDCAAILIHTPNLVHCNLDFTTLYGVLPNFTFLHLESLVLATFYSGGRDYMGSFILPTLRKLQITESLLGPTPCDSLASFLSKSGFKLQKIHIRRSRLVSKSTYRTAFPSIQFSFDGKSIEIGGSSDVEDD